MLQFVKAVGQNTVEIYDKMARMIQENRSERGSKQSNFDYQSESQSDGDNNKSIYKKVMNQQKKVLKMTMLTIPYLIEHSEELFSVKVTGPCQYFMSRY